MTRQELIDNPLEFMRAMETLLLYPQPGQNTLRLYQVRAVRMYLLLRDIAATPDDARFDSWVRDLAGLVNAAIDEHLEDINEEMIA